MIHLPKIRILSLVPPQTRRRYIKNLRDNMKDAFGPRGPAKSCKKQKRKVNAGDGDTSSKIFDPLNLDGLGQTLNEMLADCGDAEHAQKILDEIIKNNHEEEPKSERSESSDSDGEEETVESFVNKKNELEKLLKGIKCHEPLNIAGKIDKRLETLKQQILDYYIEHGNRLPKDQSLEEITEMVNDAVINMPSNFEFSKINPGCLTEDSLRSILESIENK